MRKLIILLTLFCTACTNSNNIVNEKQVKYDSINTLIVEQEVFEYASKYYDYEIEINMLSDTEFRYYVTIFNPKIAMFDIVAVAKDIDDFFIDKQMMPSKGIFEDESIHMIPGQVNSKRGYVEGIILSGIKTKEVNENTKIDLILFVEWKNEDLTVTTREMLDIEFAVGNEGEHDAGE